MNTTYQNAVEQMNESQSYPGILRLLMGAWLCIWVMPFLALTLGAVIAIPALLLKLMGANQVMLALLGLTGLTALFLAGMAIYGYATRRYYAWVMSCLAFRLASFLIGIAIIVCLFNLPFSVIGFLYILGAFVLLKCSLVCSNQINKRSFKDVYSVVKYSHY